MSKADIHRVPESIDLAGWLDQRRWDGGVRIVVHGDQASLDASWRADVFADGGRQRKPTWTLAAATPAELFRFLAELTSRPRCRQK